MPALTIPSPEFDLETSVWLHFKGAIIPTHIKVRAWFPERSAWYYRVALSGQWHQASEFTPRVSTNPGHTDDLVSALKGEAATNV